MDYYAKYIKYKTKYLELKKQMDGSGNCAPGKRKGCTYINCTCPKFVMNGTSRECTRENCKHDVSNHEC